MAEGDTRDSRSIEKTSAFVHPRSPEIARPEGGEGQSRGNQDPVVEALASALTQASAAGRFDVVAQLARELEARRLASAATVDLAAEREKRRR